MTKPTIDGIAATQSEQGRRIGKVEDEMDIVRNRLPNWAVGVITVLVGAVAHLIGAA